MTGAIPSLQNSTALLVQRVALGSETVQGTAFTVADALVKAQSYETEAQSIATYFLREMETSLKQISPDPLGMSRQPALTRAERANLALLGLDLCDALEGLREATRTVYPGEAAIVAFFHGIGLAVGEDISVSSIERWKPDEAPMLLRKIRPISFRDYTVYLNKSSLFQYGIPKKALDEFIALIMWLYPNPRDSYENDEDRDEERKNLSEKFHTYFPAIDDSSIDNEKVLMLPEELKQLLLSKEFYGRATQAYTGVSCVSHKEACFQSFMGAIDLTPDNILSGPVGGFMVPDYYSFSLAMSGSPPIGNFAVRLGAGWVKMFASAHPRLYDVFIEHGSEGVKRLRFEAWRRMGQIVSHASKLM